MAIPRAYSAAVVINDSIYVVGGQDGDNGITKTVEQYSIAKNAWTTVKPMNAKRECAAAVSANGQLMVLGGNVAGDLTKSIEIFDVENNLWNLVSLMLVA